MGLPKPPDANDTIQYYGSGLGELAISASDEWSIIRRGWAEQALHRQHGTIYHVFSIEESIALETTPKYVIIDSANLDEEGISSEYYGLVDDGDYYRGHVIENLEESPVDSCVI